MEHSTALCEHDILLPKLTRYVRTSILQNRDFHTEQYMSVESVLNFATQDRLQQPVNLKYELQLQCDVSETGHHG